MPTSKTVSTCAPETVQGTHAFQILGYSQHRGISAEKKKFIRSGSFSVGGREWALILYPDRIENEVMLTLLGPDEAGDVLASYELRLVNQSIGLSFSVHKEAPRLFNSTDHTMIASCWIKRSLFEASTYLKDDRITIECIVTVIKEPPVPATKLFPSIEEPPSDIIEHFGELLETKEGADVTFSVGSESFAGHKIVLATRSPVFKAELYGPMREAGPEPIIIKDVQPDVFRALLHFIYTDSLSPLDDLGADDRGEMVRHLLVAADRYAMERLKLMCQSILCKNLHVQTVATTLALADQHHCELLKDACIDFVTCSNAFDAVVATEGYKNLKRTCPSVVIDAMEKACRFRMA